MTQQGTQLKATKVVCLMRMVLRPLSETFCRLLPYAIILLKHLFFQNDDDDDDDDDETTTIMIICSMLFCLHFL